MESAEVQESETVAEKQGRERQSKLAAFWRGIAAPKVPLAVLVAALLILGSLMTYWAFVVMPSLRASDSRSTSSYSTTSLQTSSATTSTTTTTTPTTVAVPPGYKRVELTNARPPDGAAEHGWICSSGAFPYDENVTCFVPDGAAITPSTTASTTSAQPAAAPPSSTVDWFARAIAIGTLLVGLIGALGAVGVRFAKRGDEAPKHK